jgi:flagellin
MASVINTNISSLNAQRNLTQSASALSTSLQRLSSGLRINSAKDDAAGMAIAARMTAQINGLNQAARNANDGISLAQTAEGSLNAITDNLQRVRELAVQSANASNSASDRAGIQSEASQLIAEISRVASSTQFNGVNLLDGSFSNAAFQVGANANQTISISSIVNAQATSLGANLLSSSGTKMGLVTTAGINAVQANGVVGTTTTFTTAQGGSSSNAVINNSDSAKAIAAAINGAVQSTGVLATATTSVSISGLSAGGNITMNLNGTAITANAVGAADLTSLMTAINSSNGATGVVASFTTAGSTAALTLTAADGRNIEILTMVNSNSGTVNMGGTALTVTAGGANSATATGTVTLSSNKGMIQLAAASGTVFANATASSSLSALSSLTLSTPTGAQTALAIVDGALDAINGSKADLGAYQNRFASAVSNLQTTSENLTASRSRIQDADFAAETAAMTRGQILQQAGTAILAQANSLPNNVLSLLK